MTSLVLQIKVIREAVSMLMRALFLGRFLVPFSTLLGRTTLRNMFTRHMASHKLIQLFMSGLLPFTYNPAIIGVYMLQ